MLRKKISDLSKNTIVGYLIAFAVGVIVGFRTSPEFVGVPYVILSMVCLFFAFHNNLKIVLSVLPYLVYTEMYIRTYVKFIPYLFLPYLLIAVFGALFLQNRNNVRIHSKSFGFLCFYTIIEITDSFRCANPDIAKFLMINSIALFIIVMWSSFNVILPATVNRFLNNVKYASIYLCGIVIARYIMGDVVFSGISSSETTNGLAPVQISGYLGFSCTVFFWSIMNDAQKNNLLINLALLAVTSVVMLLSFSRGGLYFFGVIMLLYFFFNRARIKSYFLFLILIPVAVLVYFYLVSTTNGLIVDRYQQEGSSGRDELIRAGWNLFILEPLVGVGTGSFNEEIKGNKLYGAEAGAHDEFIRAAAEHGVLGIISYWGFFVFLFFEILSRKKIQKEFAIYFFAFFCMIAVHNGLKISLQPLLLMLAVATPSLVRIRKKLDVSVTRNRVIYN
jgi:O-antigen ligase